MLITAKSKVICCVSSSQVKSQMCFSLVASLPSLSSCKVTLSLLLYSVFHFLKYLLDFYLNLCSRYNDERERWNQFRCTFWCYFHFLSAYNFNNFDLLSIRSPVDSFLPRRVAAAAASSIIWLSPIGRYSLLDRFSTASCLRSFIEWISFMNKFRANIQMLSQLTAQWICEYFLRVICTLPA